MRLSSSMELTPDVASAPIEIPEESSIDEAIRRSHLRAENDVKAVGSFILIAVVWGAFGHVRSPEPMSADLIELCMLIAFGISGVLLRGLHTWGRWIYSVLAIVDLVVLVLAAPAAIGQMTQADILSGPSSLAIPNTTLLPAFIIVFRAIFVSLFLFVLWNRKARMVTSKHYRNAVIPATPHIESSHHTGLVAASVGLVVLFIAGVMLFAILAM